MPVGLSKRWPLARRDILEGYGLSETSPVATFNHRSAAFRRGDGHAPPVVEIVRARRRRAGAPAGERGEVVIRGPNIMRATSGSAEARPRRPCGTAGSTPATSASSSDGYLKIVDRKKDMILRAGFNVYPNEVEAASTACDRRWPSAPSSACPTRIRARR